MASPTLYTITPIPGKGHGLIATQTIPPGTTILTDPAILKIPVPATHLTTPLLTTAFSALPPTTQSTILSLHSAPGPPTTQLQRIFQANTFGDTASCWLHPTISRINHACTGNATISRLDDDTAQVLSEKTIAEGEEITFSYNHELYEITTAKQRAVLLQKQYGFTCVCPACTTLQAESDLRRLQIKALRQRLHGLQTSDFSVWENLPPASAEVSALSEEDFWIREEAPAAGTLSAAERAAKNVLLGKLREAEGLPAMPTAQNYLHAAEAMLEQVQSTPDVVVLGWAGLVQRLMVKATAIVDAARSPYDDDAQMLRATWGVMQVRPCMKVALGFLDGDDEIPVIRREEEVKTPYAILVAAGHLTVISRAEYIALIADGKSAASLLQSPNEEPPESWLSRSSTQLFSAAVLCSAPVVAYYCLR